MKFVVGEPYVHRSKLDPPMSAFRGKADIWLVAMYLHVS